MASDDNPVALAVALYGDGLPMTEISVRTNLSRARIRGILIGSGIPLRGNWRKRPAPSATEVTERYAAGESAGVLASAYGED